MSMREKLHQLVHAIRRSPAVISEEAYWDQYVRTQRSSPCQGPYVGSEWGNEEDFLSLLRRYADTGKRALEIGCGGGRITATAASLFAHVYAADCSQEMLRECRAAIRAPNVSFHKLDGFTLKEFADQSVEYVYSHDVFVQLSSVEVYPYLAEITRVLRPRGIGVTSFYDFVTRFDMFRQRSLQSWTARRSARHRRLHFVTQEMIQLMLTDVGAEVVEAQTSTFLTVVLRKVR
jgi:2-polyprenyl-3-methyl-5-hydroxy-6-metoxy-1,4-benzoquinol methylase